MDKMLSFDEFVAGLNKSGQLSAEKSAIFRIQKLANIQVPDMETKYFILVSLGDVEGEHLIIEHEKYQNFTRSSNRFVKHPANLDIPVQTHYHIYPSKGKNEVYAVNMDGTAHHKVNRGYEVPKKEAEELRAMGVNIPLDRIIENRQIDFSTTAIDQVFLLIE